MEYCWGKSGSLIHFFADKLLALMHAQETLSIEYEPLGLKVSWIKPKSQKFVVIFDGNVDHFDSSLKHKIIKTKLKACKAY